MKQSKIHIISTINGELNEGMRNVATHISKALEKDYTVRYSRFKNIFSIIKNSYSSYVTIIFAKANKSIYYLSRFVSLLNKNVWLCLVQKLDDNFLKLNNCHPLKINYLAISKKDLKDIKILDNYRKELIDVGINREKFKAVDKDKQRQLKIKYGFDPDKILVSHVGHGSKGRGLNDFLDIKDAERLIVLSGMFEDENDLKILEDDGVRLLRGYIENIEEIYQMSDVYFFPTHSINYVISLPLSVMEALACGTSVVAYKDFENLKDIPAKEGSILLINNKDELKDTINKASNNKNNSSYLINEKTWEEVTSEVIDYIKKK